MLEDLKDLKELGDYLNNQLDILSNRLSSSLTSSADKVNKVLNFGEAENQSYVVVPVKKRINLKKD